ncbi:MAG: hypothetical protein A2Z18_03575 [Armatimonadetes bacterium RBG_16_58_9]|nr:MAG: hypothetical protein A2Z18_03575 [Armatimonadetes bacterium RBG_16_58_9]
MEQRDTKARIVTTFATMVIVVLVVFGCSLLMQLRAEVRSLKDTLATKSDVVAVSTAGMDLSFEQQKCVRCHTERRFAGEHGTKNELTQVIERMGRHPDVRLTHQDVQKVHASLTLMKCATCHSSDEIKKLALLNEGEQVAKIRQMQRKSGSKISPDEVRDIQESFHILVGF